MPMNDEQVSEGPMTARESMTQLKSDPAWVAKRESVEIARQEKRRRFAAAEEPIQAELRGRGINVEWIGDLNRLPDPDYRRAVPILISWLPLIDDPHVKEWIARTLTDPRAKDAVPHLISEFKNMVEQPPSAARWAIGNALEVHTTSRWADELIALAADRRYGKDRSMIVLGLAKIKKDPRVLKTAIDQLDDPAIEFTVIATLRRIADPRSLPILERYATHPNAWVRNHARKGIEKIENHLAKAEGRPLPHPPRKHVLEMRAQEPELWPEGLPHDGLVALLSANLYEIEKLAGYSESALLAMNGIGTKTIARIKAELRERGLAPLSA
jgi:hypothetical protein